MDRRSALVLGGATLLAAQTQAADLPLLETDSMADSTELVPLWPNAAPGDLGTPRSLKNHGTLQGSHALSRPRHHRDHHAGPDGLSPGETGWFGAAADAGRRLWTI